MASYAAVPRNHGTSVPLPDAQLIPYSIGVTAPSVRVSTSMNQRDATPLFTALRAPVWT